MKLRKEQFAQGGEGLGGMIWHIAVHPDYRRKGIASRLLNEAEKVIKEKGNSRIEAWTRDDEWVQKWYVSNGFFKSRFILTRFYEW
jgi:ribosomal protein S18 acetylase RimI-like enzyme